MPTATNPIGTIVILTEGFGKKWLKKDVAHAHQEKMGVVIVDTFLCMMFLLLSNAAIMKMTSMGCLRIVSLSLLSVVTLCCVSEMKRHERRSSDFHIDHTFMVAGNIKDFSDLKDRGFTLGEATMEHPDSVSHFIPFPKQRNDYPVDQYLEWAIVKDVDVHIKKWEGFSTGIGIVSNSELKLQMERIQRNAPGFDIKFQHRNY